MAKRTTRRQTPRRKVSPTRQAALDERRELQSARDLQRKIRRLAGELQRAISQADDALVSVARMVNERENLRTLASLNEDPAGV